MFRWKAFHVPCFVFWRNNCVKIPCPVWESLIKIWVVCFTCPQVDLSQWSGTFVNVVNQNKSRIKILFVSCFDEQFSKLNWLQHEVSLCVHRNYRCNPQNRKGPALPKGKVGSTTFPARQTPCKNCSNSPLFQDFSSPSHNCSSNIKRWAHHEVKNVELSLLIYQSMLLSKTDLSPLR